MAHLLLTLALLCSQPLRAQQDAAWTSSAGTWSGGKDVVIAVVESDWQSLWAKAGGKAPVPAVDFKAYVVAGTFLEGGYVLRRLPRQLVMPAPLPHGLRQSHVADLQNNVNGSLARQEKGWDFSFSFGPGRTQYLPTDIRVKTSDMDVTFKHVDLRERTSMQHYDFSKNPQPLRAIDEPTNTFRITAENKKHGYAVYAQIFHPKFLVSAPGLNGHVKAVGAVQGKPVDGRMDINTVFPTYQLTYGLVNISAGGEKVIPIVKGKGGSLVYAPGASVGGFIGSSNATLRDPAQANTPKEFRAQKLKPIGASVSLTNRLTYAIPGERVNLSLAHTLTGGELDYGILDGTAHQNLSYQNLNVAVGVKLFKTRPKKKKPLGL